MNEIVIRKAVLAVTAVGLFAVGYWADQKSKQIDEQIKAGRERMAKDRQAFAETPVLKLVK